MYLLASMLIGLIAVGGILMLRNRSDDPRASASNPLEEAEVYLSYGRKREASEFLEKYLRNNPDDLKAKKLLRSIGR
jgi:hypothetical protein